MFMTVVVEVSVVSVVMTIETTVFIKKPIPTTVRMVKMTLMVMLMEESVMITEILAQRILALPWAAGSDMICTKGSGELSAM